MSRTIEVENIGPVHHLALKLPAKGGVMVLSGRNGTGKSETLEAINKMIGRDADVAAPTDGHERGVIEGLGCRMTVGRTTRRTGELEVVSLDSRLSVADVVDPGILNAEAADEKRMKAILSILQVRPELADWLELADGDADVIQTIKAEYDRAPDVLVLAARLKASFSRLASTAEQAVRDIQAKVAVLTADPRVAAEEPPELAGTVDELADRLTRANVARANLRARKARAADAATIQAQLTRLSADCGDVEKLTAEHLDAGRLVDTLRDQLEAAESRLAKLTDELRTASHTKAQIDSLQKQLERSDDVPDAELDAADAAVQAAHDALIGYEATKRVLADRETVAAAAQNAAVAKAAAETLRSVAQRPEAILAQLVQSQVPSVRFDSGRLIVTHPKRGDIPFADLSTGERWRFAMEIAIAGVGPGGLLVIPQDAWQDLDPTNRRQIAKLAEKGSVVVITAECSDEKELTATVAKS